MPQTHSVGGFSAGIDLDRNQHRRLKGASAFAVHQIPMRDLRFQDNTRFLDFGKVFKKRRPFADLLFPSALVDIKAPPHGNRSYSFLFGKVGNLFAAGFVLNEGALPSKLINGLLVCCIRDEPEGVAYYTIVVIDSGFSRHTGGWRSLKALSSHKFGIVEIVIPDSGLRLYIPCPIYLGTSKRTERC